MSSQSAPPSVAGAAQSARSTAGIVPDSVTAARQADWVAFLFRAPYALDAYELGFTIGVREDYGLQQEPYETLDLPIQMLDNDFRDPDLERYLAVFDQYQPDIGVVGDVETQAEAERIVGAVRALQRELPDDTQFEPIVVPKSLAALDAIPRDIVVGYPIGYSDIQAPDFSRPGDWAGRRIHILGGTPPTQWDAIKKLTNCGETGVTLQEYGVGADPPATIAGLDWNGLFKIALKGKYWHHERPHWRDADELTIRSTVRRGLTHVRRFWRDRGVWPDSTPVEQYGPEAVRSAPTQPGVAVCHGCGHDIDRRTTPEVVEYEDGTTFQFCSDQCRDRIEYRDGMIPLSHDGLGLVRERRRAEWFTAR